MAHWGAQEGLGAGFGKSALVIQGNGVSQHGGHVVDLGGGGGLGSQRFHAAGHHDIAERAAGGDFLGAGLECLLRAELIDARTQLFLHEHARAAGAAAEGLVVGLVHLAQFHARGLEKLARRIEDLIVAAQEAWIVIGDGLAVFRGARNRL